MYGAAKHIISDSPPYLKHQIHRDEQVLTPRLDQERPDLQARRPSYVTLQKSGSIRSKCTCLSNQLAMPSKLRAATKASKNKKKVPESVVLSNMLNVPVLIARDSLPCFLG